MEFQGYPVSPVYDDKPGPSWHNEYMTHPSRAAGNAFIYVLIAVVLFGGLTFALSKNQDATPADTISDAGAKTAALQILAYEADAKNAINGMLQSGATPDQIDFTLPSDANFNTAPTMYKLFHPDGGGLQYRQLPKSAIGTATSGPANGYYAGIFNNVEWTKSTAQDVLFSAYAISKPVCEQLNLKITGSKTIPQVNTSYTRGYTVPASVWSGSNSDITTTSCPGCDGLSAICLANSGGAGWSYYSILLGR